jgi:hypothetical protein
MANLFSDNLKSMKMKRTPVLRTTISRGSKKNHIFLLKKDMIPNNPNTASVCQSDDPVFGFQGKCVNACGKYR